MNEHCAADCACTCRTRAWPLQGRPCQSGNQTCHLCMMTGPVRASLCRSIVLHASHDLLTCSAAQRGNAGQTRAQWLSHLRQAAAARLPRLVSRFTFCEFDQVTLLHCGRRFCLRLALQLRLLGKSRFSSCPMPSGVHPGTEVRLGSLSWRASEAGHAPGARAGGSPGVPAQHHGAGLRLCARLCRHAAPLPAVPQPGGAAPGQAAARRQLRGQRPGPAWDAPGHVRLGAAAARVRPPGMPVAMRCRLSGATSERAWSGRQLEAGSCEPGAALLSAAASCGPDRLAEVVCRAAAGPAFVFHHANAYESSDGEQLVVDSVAYPRFPGFFEVGCAGGRCQAVLGVFQLRTAPAGGCACQQFSCCSPWTPDLGAPRPQQQAGRLTARWVQLGKKGYDFFRDVHPATSPISQLWRHTVCLQSGAVSQRLLCPRAAEFPGVSPAYAGAPLAPCWHSALSGHAPGWKPRACVGVSLAAQPEKCSWGLRRH